MSTSLWQLFLHFISRSVVFARTDCPQLKDLVDIIEYVKPTALFGLSTTKGAFDREVVEAMAMLNERPILFPLSNPVSLCELDFEDAIAWTDGQAIFASGSPYKPVTYKGKEYFAGQGALSRSSVPVSRHLQSMSSGNNMYVFPGIGLGAALGRSSIITDSMVTTASLSLASSLTAEEHAAGLIYPRITRIREISAQIATDVLLEARKEKLNTNSAVASLRDDQVLPWVKARMWNPVI